MANVKVSDLVTVTPTTSDLVLLSQSGTTRNASIANIRGVINDVTHTDVDKSLSANQGKLLNDKIGVLSELPTADKTSVVNSIKEINTDLSEKANKSSLDTTNDNLSTHMTDLVTDLDGAHGLKVESGAWTPTFDLAGFTYSERIGTYIKIGNFVKCIYKISITAKPASGTLYAIVGLPFTALDGNINGGSIGIFQNVIYPTDFKQFTTFINSAKNAISIQYLKDSSVGGNLTTSILASAFTLCGEISYKI